MKNPEKKVNPLFLAQVYRSLKIAKQYPHLLLAIFSTAYFLFTASFTQLNLIPYGIQSLHITDVETGYVFLAAAFGIGIGSMTVALVSGKSIELGISLWGAFGTAISYFIISFTNNIAVAVLMILSLGVHGGLYIVPLDAFIQFASPEKVRGQVVAASSFLAFVGVLIAALLVGVFSNVLHISAADGFLIIAFLTLFVSIIITILLPEYITRFVAIFLSKLFIHIDITKGEFKDSCKVILSKKLCFTTVLSLIQLHPNIAFAKVVKKPPGYIKKLFYKVLFQVQRLIANTLHLLSQK